MSHALHDLEKLYAELPPAVDEEDVQREAWEEMRGDYIRTIRFALDHLAAALTSVGCTDAELSDALGTPETDETDDGVENAQPDGACDETRETLVPTWVRVASIPGVLSPSDVFVVSGNGTEK